MMNTIGSVLLVIAGGLVLGLGIGLVFAETVTPGFGLMIGLGFGLLFGGLIVALKKRS